MNSEIQRISSLFLGVVTGIFILKFLYASFTSPRKESRPRIKKLIIYPIKSIQGVEVDHLDVNLSGVHWLNFRDRCFVLLDEKNKMITQRNEPKLALIKIELHDDVIVLNADGMDVLTFSTNIDCKSNELISFIIWDGETEGYDCGKEIENWFTKYLGSKTRLVKFVDGIKQRKSVVLKKELENTVYYQDGFPILLINEVSIEELNGRLNGKTVVSYRNFRPNFLIDGTALPYEEDDWFKIRIGQVDYTMPKPSDRCLLTTINPDIGKRNENGEPLATLKKYRIFEKLNKYSPMFGINLVPLQSGRINVGDYIEILERGNSQQNTSLG